MRSTDEIEYRLRWSKSGHRTRFYAKRAFAEKAAAKYRDRGFDVQLDERRVSVVTDWQPVDGTYVPRAAHVPKPLDELAWDALIDIAEGDVVPQEVADLYGNADIDRFLTLATGGVRGGWVRSSVEARD